MSTTPNIKAEYKPQNVLTQTNGNGHAVQAYYEKDFTTLVCRNTNPESREKVGDFAMCVIVRRPPLYRNVLDSNVLDSNVLDHNIAAHLV